MHSAAQRDKGDHANTKAPLGTAQHPENSEPFQGDEGPNGLNSSNREMHRTPAPICGPTKATFV